MQHRQLHMHGQPQLSLRPVPLIRSSPAHHRLTNVCRSHAAKTNSQDPSRASKGPAKSAAAMLAAAALLLSPMTVPAGPALAAGELADTNSSSSSSTLTPTSLSGLVAASASDQQMDQGEQAGWGAQGITAAGSSQHVSSSTEDPQPSKNPGWPMPSPMPHPPAAPPQSPAPGTPQQPSLPPGAPDLLPRQPAPGPGPQQSPKPELPPLPDVPPQLLPPCQPNPGPPQLLPPCQPPGVAPPIRPAQIDVIASGPSSASGRLTPAAADVSGGVSVRSDSPGVGAYGGASAAAAVAAAAPKPAMQLAEIALVPASPVERASGADATLGAAFDAVLAPRAADAVPAAAAPSTLDLPQGVTPSGRLDSSNMSINLDSKLAGTGKADDASSSKDGKTSSKSSISKYAGSKGTGGAGTGVASSAGTAGALDAFGDLQPGSITLEQVAKEAGKLGLQLLEVAVRIAVFLIKYTLQAFIWLVKLIAKYISSAN